MAQLTLMMDVDMDAVVADRTARKGAAVVPGYTDYVIAAAARALREHPRVNSQVTADGIALLPRVNVGMAVALDEGLVVPVVHDADQLSLETISTHTTRLAAAPFVERHIGPSRPDEQVMLDVVGHDDITALVRAAVPESILLTESLALDVGLSEPEVLAELRELASRNTVLTSMIGLGYYGTHVPGVIARNVLENPAWYTAYTPYQP